MTRIPPHIPNKVASPINCALATMVNATGSLDELIGKKDTRGYGWKATALVQVINCLLSDYKHVLFLVY